MYNQEEKDGWAEVDRGLVYLVCFVRTTAGTPPLDLRRAGTDSVAASFVVRRVSEWIG
jgi:hypothetical protein